MDKLSKNIPQGGYTFRDAADLSTFHPQVIHKLSTMFRYSHANVRFLYVAVPQNVALSLRCGLLTYPQVRQILLLLDL